VAGAHHREADVEIMEALESERSTARRLAAAELLYLLPSIVVGSAILWLGYGWAEGGAWLGKCMGWAPVGRWSPLHGLATAAVGFVIGGGIGWFVRIFATLIIGKEAFGTGDIHMMAAAGCIAGWPVVLIGFVLSSLLALLGWVLVLPFKRTRAIPFGPWLSISFLLVVLFHQPIIESRLIQNVIYVFRPALVNCEKFTTGL